MVDLRGKAKTLWLSMTDIQGNFVYLRTSMVIFLKGELVGKLPMSPQNHEK